MKNFVGWGRPQMTVWRMRIACWIPKATYTHSVCVILIAQTHLNVTLHLLCLCCSEYCHQCVLWQLNIPVPSEHVLCPSVRSVPFAVEYVYGFV